MNTIEIPKQLQQKDFRFCLIHKWDAKGKNDIELGKTPFEKEWQKKGYEFDDKKLLSHIASDKNYGCISGKGKLRIIDIDNEDLAKEFKNKLNTFTVATGGGGLHIYIKCKYDTNHVFKDGLGELRANNYQVVGPNSIHPNGKPYMVINSSKVLNISKKELMKLIKKLLKLTDKVEEEKIDVDYIEAHVIEFLPDELVHLIKTPFKNLTLELADKNFPSRSERDLSVINSLLLHGFGRFIKFIFENYACGEKYREHTGKEAYLKETIRKGRIFTGVFDDIFKELEKLILKSSKPFLINKHESILSRMLEIEDWIIQSYLINLLSEKTFIARKDLHLKLAQVRSYSIERRTVMLNTLLDMDLPDLEFWVDGLLLKDSFTMILGVPGAFKSMFTLAIITSIISKKKFLDKFDTVTKTPKILMYDLENGEVLTSRRLKYLSAGLGVKKKDLSESCTFTETFDAFNLSKELKFSKDYDIIIIDSYRRALTGNESDSEVTNKFYQDYIKPIRALGKSLIIVHHKKKGGAQTDDFSEIASIESARGSSDIGAQLDMLIDIRKENEIRDFDTQTSSLDIFIQFAKNRIGAPVIDFNFRAFRNDAKKATTFVYIGEGKKPLSPKERTKELIVQFIEKKSLATTKEIYEHVSRSIKVSERSIRKYLDELVDKDHELTQPLHGKYSVSKHDDVVDDSFKVKKDDDQKKL